MESLIEIQKWFSQNKETISRHAGKWIAISTSGIVQVADSLDGLSKKLTETQKKELLLTRVPTRKEAANIVV